MTGVLITGAGGFIGSHLVASQLAQGNRVRAADLNLDRLERFADDGLERVRADITDPDTPGRLVAGMDVVYHLASAHLDVTLSEDHYRLVNVVATRRLVEAAHQAGVRRFVHVSTNGVVGEIANPPVDETAPCSPTNVYEQTKLEGEQAVLAYHGATGFPVVVTRPAWAYGPECPRTEKLMRQVAKGRFFMFGNGRTLRHPIFIDDAVDGLERCARVENIAGEVFFLAGEAPVTVEKLVCEVAAALGVSLQLIRLPLALGIGAGYGMQLAFRPLGKQPPFSRRSVDFFLKDNAYRIDKARHRLGFDPRVDLGVGLRRTVAWWRTRASEQ